MSRRKRNYHRASYIPVRHAFDPESGEVIGTVPLDAPDPAPPKRLKIRLAGLTPEQAESNRREREYAARIFRLKPEQQLAGAQSALEKMQQIALRAMTRSPQE